MSKDKLELEAEKYARRFEENEQSEYNGQAISIDDRIEMQAFISGATSKYVEAEKLRFAIDQLKGLTEKIGGYSFDDVNNLLFKLQQQLKTIENE